jgi:hypothetical protein
MTTVDPWAEPSVQGVHDDMEQLFMEGKTPSLFRVHEWMLALERVLTTGDSQQTDRSLPLARTPHTIMDASKQFR